MTENTASVQLPATTRQPFPVERLLFSVGFAILAWFVFWAILVLAVVQFVVIAINGRANDELKRFSLRLLAYLAEMLAYILLASEVKPFPLGRFPRPGV